MERREERWKRGRKVVEVEEGGELKERYEEGWMGREGEVEGK